MEDGPQRNGRIRLLLNTHTNREGVGRAERRVVVQEKVKGPWPDSLQTLSCVTGTLQGGHPCFLETSTHFTVLGKHLPPTDPNQQTCDQEELSLLTEQS